MVFSGEHVFVPEDKLVGCSRISCKPKHSSLCHISSKPLLYSMWAKFKQDRWSLFLITTIKINFIGLWQVFWLLAFIFLFLYYLSFPFLFPVAWETEDWDNLLLQLKSKHHTGRWEKHPLIVEKVLVGPVRRTALCHLCLSWSGYWSS